MSKKVNVEKDFDFIIVYTNKTKTKSVSLTRRYDKKGLVLAITLPGTNVDICLSKREWKAFNKFVKDVSDL